MTTKHAPTRRSFTLPIGAAILALGACANSTEPQAHNDVEPTADSESALMNGTCGPKAVAVAGQTAPGTHGAVFDSNFGFDEPMISKNGNVAFIASYAPGTTSKSVTTPPDTGAGVFFWERGLNRLKPIAITGQKTDVGYLPPYKFNYDGPTIDESDLIAFAVRNITGGSATSALFQWDWRKPKVLVYQGQAAPGGGYFIEFDDLSENKHDDVAFIASYTPDYDVGVFLRTCGEDQIEAIVRAGDTLPDTGGGTLCGFPDGPWLTDSGAVLFQADCIAGGTGGLEESIFIKKPGKPLQSFLLVGPNASLDKTIGGIHIGRPGVNDSEATFLLDLENGMETTKVIATKKLWKTDVAVCATEGEALSSSRKLVLGGAPSIAADGTIAFAGESELLDESADWEAIFTCKAGTVKQIVTQGDPKPVGNNNYFGSLEESSNANGFVTFLDEGNTLQGVFISKTCNGK